MNLTQNSKILKFTIFILAFLIIVMLFVFIFVIPSIKEFKTKKTEFVHAQKQKEKLTDEIKTLQKKLSVLTKENNDSLKAFTNDFNETEFITFSKKFFDDIKITPHQTKKMENGLEVYDFSANFNAKTPIRFYNFVDGLKNLKSVVKINFPIVLDSKSDKIKLKFNMSVYRLDKTRVAPKI